MTELKEGYLTVTDFLTTYAMSRSAFYRAVNDNQIRLTKIGRSSRVARVDAQRWADNLPTIGGEASA